MLHGVAMASLEETGGGEGVEVLKNEPFTDKPLLNGKYPEVKRNICEVIQRSQISKYIHGIMIQADLNKRNLKIHFLNVDLCFLCSRANIQKRYTI